MRIYLSGGNHQNNTPAPPPPLGQAETKIIKTSLRMGIQPRIELIGQPDPDVVQRYSDLGVTHW